MIIFFFYFRLALISTLGFGVPAFFAMRKIEIAFHDKCKAKAEGH